MGSRDWITALSLSSESASQTASGHLGFRLKGAQSLQWLRESLYDPRPSPSPRPRPPPLRPPRARGLAPRGLPWAQRPAATRVAPKPARSLCSGGLARPKRSSGSEGGGTRPSVPWRLEGSWTQPGNRRVVTCCWRCWHEGPTCAEVGARRSGCTGQAQIPSGFFLACKRRPEEARVFGQGYV